MSEEEKKEKEKQILREWMSKQSRRFSSPSPASPSGDQQQLKKSDGDRREESDWLMATYWG